MFDKVKSFHIINREKKQYTDKKNRVNGKRWRDGDKRKRFFLAVKYFLTSYL